MMQDIKQFEQAGILVSEPNSRNGWDYRFSETGRALTLTLLNHPIRTEKTHQAERPSETRPQAPTLPNASMRLKRNTVPGRPQ